jgi:hypothetical protein
MHLREIQVTMKKSNRFLLPAGVFIVLLIMAAGGVYAWYFLYHPCEVNTVKETSAILISQANTYDRVYQSAINAPATLVDGPVVTMQQILMDTKEVVVPACMQTAKDELLNYMTVVIRAFRSFAALETEATVRDLVNKSDQHYGNFITELKAVNQCAPLCFP